ncbi:MAG: LysR family transcriptional regulator [Hyphomicrobiales bacterium]|nr:LysR family transcriptional regulator [Hyphomicrobiales bacterium]
MNELRAFVKIVQLGSITRAAEELHTSKSHLSRTLSALETRLRVSLIQRSTRSLRLTEIGRDFFARSLAILQSVEEAQLSVQRTRQAPVGRLSLTCGPEFGVLRVNGWINSFLQKHPQVSVQAEYTSRVVDLIHEGFDLAIRLGALRDSALATRKLGALEYGYFASKTYFAHHAALKHPRDLLDGHDLLTFTRGGTANAWNFSREGETLDIPHDGRLAVNNVFALRDAVAAGLGIARLPLIAVRDLPPSTKLVRLFRDWRTPDVPIHAVFVSSRYLSPNVRGFIDHAIAQTRKDSRA